MSTVHDQFVGTADETVYGTPVAPANFYEILTDGVSGAYERIESDAIRGPVLRADRFAPNPKGAAGDFEVEVLDKGFEFWLKHMLGAVVLATGVHTATVGSTEGKSFTYQAGRYASGSASLVPFTYAGGKVASWELGCAVDEIVKAKLTCDFASEEIDGTGAAALAVPSYPVGAQLLTFIGGTIQVAGSAFAVSAVNVTGSNGLKVDRYAMRGGASTTKREPKETELKEFGFSLTAEFEDTSMSERVSALLAAGTLATLDLSFNSPQGGTLDITATDARFDEGPVAAQRDLTSQELTGKLLGPATGSPLTVVYTPAT